MATGILFLAQSIIWWKFDTTILLIYYTFRINSIQPYRVLVARESYYYNIMPTITVQYNHYWYLVYTMCLCPGVFQTYLKISFILLENFTIFMIRISEWSIKLNKLCNNILIEILEIIINLGTFKKEYIRYIINIHYNYSVLIWFLNIYFFYIILFAHWTQIKHLKSNYSIILLLFFLFKNNLKIYNNSN